MVVLFDSNGKDSTLADLLSGLKVDVRVTLTENGEFHTEVHA
jgi:hypothetical protein